MSYYRLQARAPEPKKKKAALRFAPPCARNPLWQGLSAALAIMSLYQIHYSNFPQYRGFNTPTIILGLGGASWGVQTLFSCTPRRIWAHPLTHITGIKDIQYAQKVIAEYGEGVKRHRSCAATVGYSI
jgi:hypothetical protein